MKVDVLNWDKKKEGQVELSTSVFKTEIRADLISDLIRWQRARKRQGTHNTKDRGDVRGGGIKPFRQKGTGNARQGSIRSPLLRKGGVIHGPHPKSYAYKLPSKIRKRALVSVLSSLYEGGTVYVVSDMVSEQAKTKDIHSKLQRFGVKRALLVDTEKDTNFNRACRNLKDFQYTTVQGLNGFDLLKYQTVIFTKASVEKVNANYGDQDAN